MEGIINTIVGLSASANELQSLQTYLKSQDHLIQNSINQLLSYVQALDVANHSFGILYLLDAYVKASNAQPSEAFLDYVSRFLPSCSSSQIQTLPESFCSVCKRFKEQLVSAGHPRKGILPLKAAISKLQPSPETLTPIHADFFQLCILSRCYNAAASVVEQDIYDVNPAKTSLTPTDLYLYCYYGGLICIGRKQYARALELLLQATTAPSSAGNAIVVAAYKKWILISLIYTGSVPTFPKFVPSKSRQILEAEGRAYCDLDRAVSSSNQEKVWKVLEQHTATYNNDNNMGLVNLVLAQRTRRAIAHLTRTFLTLSLADIATAVGLPDAKAAETHLIWMVDEGEIHAQINNRDGMVKFLEDTAQYDSAHMSERINACIERCIAVAGKLQAANELVIFDRQYLMKASAKDRGHRADPGNDDVASHLQYPA